MNIEQRIKRLELVLIPCSGPPITGFKVIVDDGLGDNKSTMLEEGYRLVRDRGMFRLWDKPDQ